MTSKLQHDLADEISTLTTCLDLMRRTQPSGEALSKYLATLERATTRLWALVQAEPIQEDPCDTSR